jgi:hypothetical protein
MTLQGTVLNIPAVMPVMLSYLLTHSVAIVCKRTIPTERPQLVGEVSANFCR